MPPWGTIWRQRNGQGDLRTHRPLSRFLCLLLLGLILCKECQQSSKPLGWELGAFVGRQLRGWDPLAPVTLLGGRRLGDDAHAGAAAAHVAAAGGTEAAAAAPIAVAAPAHREAAAPTVACAPGRGDHGCGEKAQGTLAGSSSFPRPTLPGSGAPVVPFHGAFSRNRNPLSSLGAEVRESGHRFCPHHTLPRREQLQKTSCFSKPLHSYEHTVRNGPERMPLLQVAPFYRGKIGGTKRSSGMSKVTPARNQGIRLPCCVHFSSIPGHLAE